MLRLVGPFIVCSLALANTPAIAQAGATPLPASGEAAAQQPASAPSVAGELCPTLEQAAGENGLPFDFFVRASYGKKVASTRWRSAPRALKALRNSWGTPSSGCTLRVRGCLLLRLFRLDIWTASLRVLSWACLGAWLFFVAKPRWQVIQRRLSMPCRCLETLLCKDVRGALPPSTTSHLSIDRQAVP